MNDAGRKPLTRLVAGAAAGMLAWTALQILGVFRVPALTLLSDPVWLPAVGAVAAHFCSPRGPFILAAITWAMMLGVGFTPVMRPAVRALLVDDAPRAAPAIVVLGSDIRPDGTPDRAMQARLDHAYELVADGVSHRLVVTRPGMRDLSYVPRGAGKCESAAWTVRSSRPASSGSRATRLREWGSWSASTAGEASS